MKRQRGRNTRRNNNNNNNNNTPNPNRSLDSNGPDVKIRGSANTIYEKYVGLARDAKTSGNRVKAENLLQHAEHYLRVHQKVQAKVDAIKAEKEAARLAREEQQRQNASSNENNDGDTHKSEKSDRGEGRTRNRSRRAASAKSDADTKTSETSDQAAKEPVNGLEVVTPDGGSDSSDAAPKDNDDAKPVKPRRRRAPARVKASDEDSTSAVAE